MCVKKISSVFVCVVLCNLSFDLLLFIESICLTVQTFAISTNFILSNPTILCFFHHFSSAVNMAHIGPLGTMATEKTFQDKMHDHLSLTRSDTRKALQRFERYGVKIDRRFQRDFIKQTTDW